jgi:hypothetical protein
MAKISEACISAAQAAFKTINKVDLERYVIAVFNKSLEYTDMKGQAAIDRAIKEVGDEQAQVFMEDMQRKVNDQAKFEKRSQPIQEKKARLLDVLVRRKSNLSDNVESAQNAARKTLMDSFINRLTADELGYIHNGRNDVEIMRALDGKPAGDMAKAIADKLNGYREIRNSEEVNSGALLLSHLNKDRFLKATHDVARILRGGRNLVQSALSKRYPVEAAKELWKNSIRPLLDLRKTFEGTDAFNLDGTVDMARVETMLSDIFDNITTGKALTIGGGKKQEMFFYWKDNESWMKYNKQFGKGTLLNAIRSDVQASSSQIGLANMFGSNPTATYNTLAKLENEINPQSTTTKKLARMSYGWLSGLDRAPVAPNLRSFFASVNGITGAAKLVGRVTLLSVPDIANGITFANRYGYSYFKAYGTYLGGLFNAIKTEERKYVASLFKEMTDTHMGYMMRFIDADGAGEVVNNFNNLLYRATFMDALDRGNKISALQLMARILGDNAAHEHAALNDTAKGMLEKFNINDAEWNAIRKHAKTLNGRKLLTTDSVDSLTDADIRKIYGADDTRPLYQLKNELHRKVYSMFDVASENSVLTPGAFMRASTNIHTDSIPIVGEILRSMLQFKMYPLEFADRVLFQGMSAADGIQNKLKFGALLFGATLPMSWASMYLDNHARGKTMPDFDKMGLSEKINYTKDLLFPGLGLLGSFLDPNNQSPNAAAKLLSTPAMQLLYEAVVEPIKITEGLLERDMTKVKKAFKEIGKSVIPGQGLPFVSPYMRQMFGDKPYLQPGQKQLYGA